MRGAVGGGGWIRRNSALSDMRGPTGEILDRDIIKVRIHGTQELIKI